MFESLDEFEKSLVDFEFRDALFGYNSIDFNVEKEAELAINIFTKFKKYKFLSSRWLNFLSGSMLIKENLLDSSHIINSLNFEELFEPPYKLATNKSSLNKAMLEKEKEVLDVIKEIYIDSELSNKQRRRRIIEKIKEIEKYKHMKDIELGELAGLKSERKKNIYSIIKFIRNKIKF